MKNVMIASSYPTIITSGGNPRVNKDLVNDVFLKKYISLLAELFKVKKNIRDIKIVYLGGYSKEENISRAKLYLSAYQYFLTSLGFEGLSKSNLTLIEPDNILENAEKIEQCDLLFLGIGCDRVFANTVLALEENGIILRELIQDKNMIVSSICSGSVMSSQEIYGGMYDYYYYGAELYNYPNVIPSLGINPVTMETDFRPNDATLEKTEVFIEEYLKPDSKCLAFFACRPNSFFFILENQIYSYGEIYLFMDGECFKIEGENEKADVTQLVALVNQYNQLKQRKEVFDVGLSSTIQEVLLSLVQIPIETELSSEEQRAICTFAKQDEEQKRKRKNQVDFWKQNLKEQFNFLFSEENLNRFRNDLELQARYQVLSLEDRERYFIDSSKDFREELYLKDNLFHILMIAYQNYSGYYSDFKQDLYDLLLEYVSFNDVLVYYIICICGALFSNSELKKLLKMMGMDIPLRPQKIIDMTVSQVNYIKERKKNERS